MNELVAKGLVVGVKQDTTKNGTQVTDITLVGKDRGIFHRTRVRFFRPVPVEEGRPYLVLARLSSPSPEKEVSPVGYLLLPTEGVVSQDNRGPYLEGGFQEVRLFGRLGTDPEAIVVNENDPERATLLTRFRLALHLRGRGGERTGWITVKAWGEDLAESLDSLKKGDGLLLVGRYRLSRYTNREGQERYAPYVELREVLGIARPKGEKEGASRTFPEEAAFTDLEFPDPEDLPF